MMRFKTGLIMTVVIAGMIFAGCGRRESAASGKLRVVCGLPPVAFIAEKIGGDRIVVSSMLPEGRSPHDYAPRPADIRNAGQAGFFFTTGMNFEKSAVRSLPETVAVKDVSINIKRRNFDDGQGCCDGHGHNHDHHGEESLDPHVWLSPDNAVSIAAVICDLFCEKDPANAPFYRKNFSDFKQQMARISQEIGKRLKPFAGREFLVYHPAFGYFADAAGLRQYPLEINGREMTARQLATVISKAKKDNVKVIFVQKQFNPRLAGELAAKINGSAMPLDPLAFDLVKNFEDMIAAIEQGFGGK